MKIKGIEFAFGVGGDSKMNSSSWILQNYFNYTEDRIWGKFSHLFNCPGVRVKDLVIDSNKGMSFQKHFKRNEIWFIYKGSCIVNHSKNDPENYKEITLNKDETMFIKANEWHQIINPFSSPCHIIEIQYGKEVSEEDIKRLYFYDKN